jgi:hypothetical protein
MVPDVGLSTKRPTRRSELKSDSGRWVLRSVGVPARNSPNHPAQANAIFLAIEMLLESAQGADSGEFGRLAEFELALELELAHLTGPRLPRIARATASLLK